MTSLEDDNSELCTRLGDLLVSQKHVDCCFRVEKTNINCHKLILSAASPVFEAMFYGPLAERKCIDIPDISLEAFQMMLEYVYTNKFRCKPKQLATDLLIELYYCAEKYMLSDLAKKSVGMIKSSLGPTNILEVLDTAILLDIKSLINIAISFFNVCCINSYSFAIALQQYYYHVSKNCLNFIINTNPKGNLLTNLIKEWCHYECNSLGLNYKLDEHIKLVLCDIIVPSDILLEVCDSTSYLDQNIIWLSCQRMHLKAVRPFIIGEEMEFIAKISVDHYIVMKALNINSRLFFPGQNSKKSTHYTERFLMEIYTNDRRVHQQDCFIPNVEFNSSFDIILNHNVVLSPNCVQTLKIIWDDTCLGWEYPRSIFENRLKTNLCTIHFDDDSGIDVFRSGSIINGLKYTIVS